MKHTKKFRIDQPVTSVFPLFSPEGEKSWVPGWDYENVMDTTVLHEDYIFITKNHDHSATDAIWIVKRYDPESFFVQFYKIEPDNKIGVISVQCNPIEHAGTEVEVTYEYISIGENGDKFVKGFDQAAFSGFIGEWKTC